MTKPNATEYLGDTSPALLEQLHAEQMAAHWLYLGNRASERGDHAKAERHYAKSQQWHDTMNRLMGRG